MGIFYRSSGFHVWTTFPLQNRTFDTDDPQSKSQIKIADQQIRRKRKAIFAEKILALTYQRWSKILHINPVPWQLQEHIGRRSGELSSCWVHITIAEMCWGTCSGKIRSVVRCVRTCACVRVRVRVRVCARARLCVHECSSSAFAIRRTCATCTLSTKPAFIGDQWKQIFTNF